MNQSSLVENCGKNMYEQGGNKEGINFQRYVFVATATPAEAKTYIKVPNSSASTARQPPYTPDQ
jgi:hypothetical protein